MIETSQASFTAPEIEQLPQVRLSVLAFQNRIASLPADEQNNAHTEEFNQLRLEAKALLKDPGFDKKVAKAVNEAVLAERSQRVILPRLSGIVIFGVILALLGLGINSIILDDLVINSLACLVSSGGMALVIGAFIVWALTISRGRLSNLGDLYLLSDALLREIDHTLDTALPGWADRPAVEIPEIPSVVALALDSLNKQAGDWQEKLRDLEEQRLTLGPDAPLDLKINGDFVQRELRRVRQEIDRLRGRAEVATETEVIAAEAEERRSPGAKIIMPPGVRAAPEPTDSRVLRRAKSATMDMPVLREEEAPPEIDRPTLEDEAGNPP